ncbi:MAG: hypothetical protein M3065_22270 [Actinomycetota bacterium]|nr:hypothetical protein [Actinomycetota bacterium]
MANVNGLQADLTREQVREARARVEQAFSNDRTFNRWVCQLAYEALPEATPGYGQQILARLGNRRVLADYTNYGTGGVINDGTKSTMGVASGPLGPPRMILLTPEVEMIRFRVKVETGGRWFKRNEEVPTETVVKSGTCWHEVMAVLNERRRRARLPLI